MQTEEKIKSITSLLESNLHAIVAKPERVSIYTSEREENGESVMQINIKVADEDTPVCIGRGGSTAEALRRIIILAAQRIGYERTISMRVDAPPLPRNLES